MDDLPSLSASANADHDNQPQPLSDLWFFVIVGSVVLAEMVAIVAWLVW